MSTALTHLEISHIGAAYLTRKMKCSVVLVEPANMQTREVPDVLGFLPNGDSILIEVKRSLQDFKSDAKKKHRQSIGMGFTRYYLTPLGLLKETDLPDDRWGWLEVSEGTGKVFLRRKGTPFPKAHEIRAEEMPLILHQLKKAGRREKTAIFADTDDKLFEKAARLYMSRKGKGMEVLAILLNLQEREGLDGGTLKKAIDVIRTQQAGKTRWVEAREDIRNLLAEKNKVTAEKEVTECILKFVKYGSGIERMKVELKSLPENTERLQDFLRLLDEIRKDKKNLRDVRRKASEILSPR